MKRKSAARRSTFFRERAATRLRAVVPGAGHAWHGRQQLHRGTADRGLTTPGAFKNSGITTSASAGPSSGPAVALRSASDGGLQEHRAGHVCNANAGNPNSWTHAPDRSRPAYQAASFNIFALRLTGQTQRQEQGQRLVGRAEALRRRGVQPRRRGVPSLRAGSNHLRRRIADARMLGNERPGDRRLPQHLPAGAAGALDVARDESLAARSRNGHAHEPVGELDAEDPNLIPRRGRSRTTGVAPGQPCEHGIANVTFRSPNCTHWTRSTTTGPRIDDAGLAQHQGGYQGSHLGTTRPTTATISS